MDELTRVAERIVAGDHGPAGVGIGVRTAGVTRAAYAGERGDGVALSARTRHDLASVTKVVATTTALMRLVSGGQVGLADRADRYIRGLKSDVDLRDLLTHRGGLWEWQPLYLRSRNTSAGLRQIASLPARYRPRTRRRYSDLGFMMLGEVVARACDTTLDESIRQLVTEPLGLTSTSYGPVSGDVATSARDEATEQAMIARRRPYPVLDSTAFQGWRRGPIRGEVNDGNAFHTFGGIAGHAGLFSTLDDLLRWAEALSCYREHDRLWRPEVVERFLAAGPDAGQSLGFRSWPSPARDGMTVLYGHPGFVGCAVGFAPGRDTAIAMCANRLMAQATPEATETLWSHVRLEAGPLLEVGR